MGKTYDRAGVEAAINRSAKAHAAWKKQTALARADVLLAWYNLMLEHKENLAQILTAEQGKPLAEARGEMVMQHHSFAGLRSKLAVLMVKF